METRINWGNENEREEILLIDRGDHMTIRDLLSGDSSITFAVAGNEILSLMIRHPEKYRGYDIVIAPGAIIESAGEFFRTSCKYLFAPSVVLNGKIIHDSILAPEEEFWHEFVRRYS